MGSIKGMDPKDPKYVKQAQWQRKLKDDAKWSKTASLPSLNALYSFKHM